MSSSAHELWVGEWGTSWASVSQEINFSLPRQGRRIFGWTTLQALDPEEPTTAGREGPGTAEKAAGEGIHLSSVGPVS